MNPGYPPYPQQQVGRTLSYSLNLCSFHFSSGAGNFKALRIIIIMCTLEARKVTLDTWYEIQFSNCTVRIIVIATGKRRVFENALVEQQREWNHSIIILGVPMALSSEYREAGATGFLWKPSAPSLYTAHSTYSFWTDDWVIKQIRYFQFEISRPISFYIHVHHWSSISRNLDVSR